MAEIVEMLEDFGGLAVKYDTGKNPFFRPIVVENLRKIRSCAAGKTLLKLINDARPRHRADFAVGVNVMVKPTTATYVQSGHKLDFSPGSAVKDRLVPSSANAHVAPAGCPYYILGGSQNVAKDAAHTGDGQGSVCDMNFTNVQIITTKGEKSHPFIVLAHELIHSYHCLYGIRKDDGEEEWTTGIGLYRDEPLCENVFRTQLAPELGLRLQYS